MDAVTIDDVESGRFKFPKRIYAYMDSKIEGEMSADRNPSEVAGMNTEDGVVAGVYVLVEVRHLMHRDACTSRLIKTPAQRDANKARRKEKR